MTLSLHPMIGRRLARLVALGATPQPDRKMRWLNLAEVARHPLQAAIVVGLLLLLVPLGVVLVLAVAYITAIVMTIALAAGLAVVTAVLGP
jgi:hypothetical protein